MTPPAADPSPVCHDAPPSGPPGTVDSSPMTFWLRLRLRTSWLFGKLEQ
ncbi:hypothetical protein [Catellatospora sichuanensis]|nr:hypothetical protein [Catellatospora sichuanensis]